MNRAARVSSVAFGGQVVMSINVLDQIRNEDSLLNRCCISDLGSFKLKGKEVVFCPFCFFCSFLLLSPGLADETQIFQVLPATLSERSFLGNNELLEEKKNLDAQLKELQTQNEELRTRLNVMGAELSNSMNASKVLLGEIHSASSQHEISRTSLREWENRLLHLLKEQEKSARDVEAEKETSMQLAKKTSDLHDEEISALTIKYVVVFSWL